MTVSPAPDPTPGVRPRHINLLANAAGSASIIFIPLYARQFAATNDQIGFIVASFNGFVLFASFVFGRAADLYGIRRFLRAGLALSAVAALTQIVAHDPWTVALSRAFLGFTSGMFPAALLAYAKTADRLIGRFASLGSLGWAVGTLAAGFLDWISPGVLWPVFGFSAGLYFAGFLLSGGAPLAPEGRVRIPFLPVEVLRRNLPIYLSVLIRHTGANMVWVIFTLYLADIGRMSGLQIGIVFTLNPLVQFLVMRRTDRLSSGTLLATGLGLSAVTFLTFTVSADFAWILGTQVLLGVSWATLYTGALRFIAEQNREMATAGGLLTGVLSVSSIIGPIAGGLLSSTQADLRASYVVPMYAAGAMSLASLVAYLWARPAPAVPTRAPAARSSDSERGSGESP